MLSSPCGPTSLTKAQPAKRIPSPLFTTSTKYPPSPTARGVDYKLSYEGWMIIVGSLTLGDISRLSRTSSYMLDMLRPIIFQHVALVPTSTYSPRDMNDMLKRLHRALAAWVEAFSVFMFPNKRLAREMASNALKAIFAMDSIMVLGLTGAPLVYSEKEQHDLCQFLRKCEGLVHIHFGPFTILRDVAFPVSGLHSLDYKVFDPCPSLYTMLDASSLTLTKLELDIDVEEAHDDEEMWRELWSRRLPCLRLLQIGRWDLKLDNCPNLKSFLVAHHKTLEQFQFNHIGACGISTITFVPTDTDDLAFRSIQATDAVIVPLIADHFERLQNTLESISISHYCPEMEEIANATATLHESDDSDSDLSDDGSSEASWTKQISGILDELADATDSRPALPALKMLYLPFKGAPAELDDSVSSGAYFESLMKCSRILGSLEMLSGALPAHPDFLLEDLKYLLCRFPALKSVDIAVAALGDDPAAVKQSAETIGQSVKTLQVIRAVTTHERAVALRLDRSPSSSEPNAPEKCTVSKIAFIQLVDRRLPTSEECGCGAGGNKDDDHAEQDGAESRTHD